MATKKNAHPNPVELPTTIKIPGGTATFYKESELPKRAEREISILTSQLNSQKIKAISQAKEIKMDDEVVTEDDILQGEQQTLTEREARLFFRLTDVAMWAYLKSWSLKENGEPRPLPVSPDAVIDMPRAVYDTIEAHVAKLMARRNDLGGGEEKFSPAAAGDEDSPTEA